jgi:hypothetical protein
MKNYQFLFFLILILFSSAVRANPACNDLPSCSVGQSKDFQCTDDRPNSETNGNTYSYVGDGGCSVSCRGGLVPVCKSSRCSTDDYGYRTGHGYRSSCKCQLPNRSFP